MVLLRPAESKEFWNWKMLKPRPWTSSCMMTARAVASMLARSLPHSPMPQPIVIITGRPYWSLPASPPNPATLGTCGLMNGMNTTSASTPSVQ